MAYMTEQHRKGVSRLQSIGIRTAADLDTYRSRHDPHNSRFGVLKSLVGFDAAMWILNDLALCKTKTVHL